MSLLAKIQAFLEGALGIDKPLPPIPVYPPTNFKHVDLDMWRQPCTKADHDALVRAAVAQDRAAAVQMLRQWVTDIQDGVYRPSSKAGVLMDAAEAIEQGDHV